MLSREATSRSLGGGGRFKVRQNQVYYVGMYLFSKLAWRCMILILSP